MTPQAIKNKYKTLFDINNELRNLVGKIINIHHPTKGYKDIIIIFALAKAYKTHGVVLSICELGYGEDAAMLVRSMFELSVTASYILQDKTNARAERYLDHDWILRKRMYDYILTNSHLSKITREREAKAKVGDITSKEVLEMAVKMQAKHGYKRLDWSDKSIKGMARDTGKIEQYETVYNLQSQMEHTATRTMNNYIKKTKTGFGVQTGPSDNWIQESLISGFNFLYDIAGEYDKHYELGFAKLLDAVVDKWVKAIETDNQDSL